MLPLAASAAKASASGLPARPRSQTAFPERFLRRAGACAARNGLCPVFRCAAAVGATAKHTPGFLVEWLWRNIYARVNLASKGRPSHDVGQGKQR
jgi:hypothetical protein